MGPSTMSVVFYPLCHNDSLLSCSSRAHRRRLDNNTAETTRIISPNIEFEEQPNAYSVSADLPGLGEEDVKLEVHHGVLSIAAEKKVEAEQIEGEDDGKPVTSGSRTTRAFRHSFKLPEDVDEQGISAHMTRVFDPEPPEEAGGSSPQDHSRWRRRGRA